MAGQRYGFIRGRLPAGKVRDERGTVLLTTVALIVVLLLLAGLAADFARVWVAREELQTAVDAASLAGARNAVRYVTLTVERGHEECDTCCDEEGCWTCCWCESDGIEQVSGREKELLEQGGWRRDRCDRLLGTERRWLEFPSDTSSVATGILEMNWPDLLSGESGEEGFREIEVYGSGPHYPSVAVRAAGSVKTTLVKLAGIESITVGRCGQSGAFYDIIEGGWLLGRNAAPEDACR